MRSEIVATREGWPPLMPGQKLDDFIDGLFTRFPCHFPNELYKDMRTSTALPVLNALKIS
jgi:hypothetical protein